MATRIWRGDAVDIAQVVTVQVTADDSSTTYTITINNKDVSVAGSGVDVDTTAAALQAALDASTIPEFAEVTWTVATDTITGTADTAGKPFTATSSATGGWMPRQVSGLHADSKDQTIMLLEYEGDLVVPRRSGRDFFLPGSIVTVAVAPLASAIACTVLRSLACSASRMPVSKVRIVPSISTSSGMILPLTPPWMLPMVITAGPLVISRWRLGMPWIAVAICAAT